MLHGAQAGRVRNHSKDGWVVRHTRGRGPLGPRQDRNVTNLLAGVRVLDLTTVLAGPFAGYQLSLLGADVIKIEMPGSGDLSRDLGDVEALRDALMAPPFLAQNAGKRSFSVDLKSEPGRGILRRLLETSDVLLENMRPGVLTRLGFSWEVIHEINPRLIYCALTGFGQTGPLAERTAYDQIIQGLAGMSAVTGLETGDPLRVGFPICDTLGGFAAVMAICAALARRVNDAEGCFLDVSMLETALTAMGWVVSEQLIAGRPAARHGNQNAASSPSGTFDAADGPINIATNTQTQFHALCDALGRPELATDPRFIKRTDRKRNRDALTCELEATLRTRPAAEWESLLAEVSVPCGRVLTLDEALHHEQVRVRELVHEIAVDLPDRDHVAILGSGVHVNGAALAPTMAPPRLGEHTGALLAELGYTPEQIGEFRDQRVI